MTTTIRCGHCNGLHSSAAAVRQCAEAKSQPLDDPFAETKVVDHDEFVQIQEQHARREPPATERQRDYLRSLLEEIDGVGIVADDMTRSQASRLIDEAKRRKYAGMEAKAAERSVAGGGARYVIDDGLYRRPDGTVVLVYHTVHGANRQVAKRLVVTCEDGKYKGTWKYEGMGGKAGLTKDDKCTEEDARQLGILYGFCVRCSKQLNKAESQFVGYGQTCAGHEGWYYPTKAELRELTASGRNPEEVLK